MHVKDQPTICHTTKEDANLLVPAPLGSWARTPRRTWGVTESLKSPAEPKRPWRVTESLKLPAEQSQSAAIAPSSAQGIPANWCSCFYQHGDSLSTGSILGMGILVQTLLVKEKLLFSLKAVGCGTLGRIFSHVLSHFIFKQP
jgi:hypothetical protein